MVGCTLLAVGAGGGGVLERVGVYGRFAGGERGPSGLQKVGVLIDEFLSLGVFGLFGVAGGEAFIDSEPLHFSGGGVAVRVEYEPLL